MEQWLFVALVVYSAKWFPVTGAAPAIVLGFFLLVFSNWSTEDLCFRPSVLHGSASTAMPPEICAEAQSCADEPQPLASIPRQNPRTIFEMKQEKPDRTSGTTKPLSHSLLFLLFLRFSSFFLPFCLLPALSSSFFSSSSFSHSILLPQPLSVSLSLSLTTSANGPTLSLDTDQVKNGGQQVAQAICTRKKESVDGAVS